MFGPEFSKNAIEGNPCGLPSMEEMCDVPPAEPATEEQAPPEA